jgi:hypothetical protein
MRFFLLSILLFGCSTDMRSQIKQFDDFPKEVLEQMDKMGIDDCLFLTELESSYFNILFHNDRKDFDFTAKKVAFITGSSGKTFGSKKEYFKGERTSLQRNSSPTPVQLLVFDATQKSESGGYDAAIVYWSKRLVPINEVVKILREQH